MFNGNGLTRPRNDNDKFQYNARLMWQPNGNQVLAQRAWVSGALYSEADFESTTVPLYALGRQLRAQRLPRHDDRQRPEVERRRHRRHLQVQGLLRDRRVLLPRARRPRPAPKFDVERRLRPGRHDAQPVPHLGSGASATASASVIRPSSTTTTIEGDPRRRSATTTAATPSSSRWTSAASRPGCGANQRLSGRTTSPDAGAVHLLRRHSVSVDDRRHIIAKEGSP